MNVENLASELIGFYEKLLDTEIDFDESSRISERMETLDSIEGDSITEGQLSALLKASLHGMAFSLMSGNLYSTPNNREWTLQNLEDLGDLSEIRGELTGKSRSNADTLLFETLVRAWYGQEFNQTFPDLTDSDEFDENDKRCEFVIERSDTTQMIEAKKLTSCRTDEKLERNFRTNLNKAEEQFKSTEEVLGLENAASHLIVDISRHSNTAVEVEHDERNIKMTGLTLEEIRDTKEIIEDDLQDSNIDQFTLVADRIYEVEGKPRAITQRAETIRKDEAVTDYQGWTVSGLTGYLTNTPVKRLGIYSEVKPQEWLTAGQDGLDGNYFSQQAAERTENPK
jgi:hypothetical protein